MLLLLMFQFLLQICFDWDSTNFIAKKSLIFFVSVGVEHF